jgi:predicted HicB family RNase H-like nuclease
MTPIPSPWMGKESLKGTAWYEAQGLVSVVVRIRKGTHRAYKRRAVRMKKSLQQVLRKALEQQAPKR